MEVNGVPDSRQTITLPELAMQMRSLFTGYILMVGVGLLMAGVQILLTHGIADGKFGISIDDIVYSYYGNRFSRGRHR